MRALMLAALLALSGCGASPALIGASIGLLAGELKLGSSALDYLTARETTPMLNATHRRNQKLNASPEVLPRLRLLGGVPPPPIIVDAEGNVWAIALLSETVR
jgi:hypothetical protein